MIIRKTILIQETIKVDGHGEPCNPVTRVAALAVLQSPLAGRFIQDLSPSFDMGGDLGEMLMTRAVSMLALEPVGFSLFRSKITNIDKLSLP